MNRRMSAASSTVAGRIVSAMSVIEFHMSKGNRLTMVVERGYAYTAFCSSWIEWYAS